MLNTENIKFGTDGWRGIIAKDFTFENVKIVSQGIADYFNSIKKINKDIIIGYDLRFLSKKYAGIISEVISGNGFTAYLSKNPVSTPVVSFNVVNKKALGGIMVTASHNPPHYNGIKVKSANGAVISPEETKKIESFLYKFSVLQNTYSIRFISLENDYFKKLISFVDMKSINKSKFKVVIDPMFGSSQGYLLNILSKSKLELLPIHHYKDALFGGIRPEPLEHNLIDLKKEVLKNNADVGLATDGDGDRIAIIDDTGRFLSAQHIIPLIMIHLLENKKWSGGVVKTNATTSAVEIIAKDYGLKLYQTPVGFKYIADLMLKEDILIGGEESGGIGVKNYIPERDGILIGLLILEMMAQTGKKVSALLLEIEKKYGKFCYDRIDIKYNSEKKQKIFNFLNTVTIDKISGHSVQEITRYDGTKFIMKDLSWLLIRASGTEPIVRIYAEANSTKKVKDYLKWGTRSVLDI
ncbi:MAG: phosphoglucomutase/phosphomannomutase family protein [Candidatus Firestonebacteria bacterium]